MVTKSACCCGSSQFGLPKGWGFPCQVCPMTGSFEFDQLCPHGDGFTNSGDDINECATNPKICGDHGDCENIQGSYRCKCEPGFQPDPTGKKCEDIDECSDPFNCRKGICDQSFHNCGNFEKIFSNKNPVNCTLLHKFSIFYTILAPFHDFFHIFNKKFKL